MSIKNEFHVPIVIEDETAVALLANTSSLSRQKIKQAMQKGCVWLEKGKYTQRLRRAKKVLSKGDVLHLYYDSKILETEPPTATLVSDEGDYSIWNKPSGMFSQGSKWGDHCTINRWAEKHLKPERSAFIVHRLDRAASGLIIIVHKKQVAAKFAKMFKQGEIEKHYCVKVQGDFSQVYPDKIVTISEEIDDKKALSHVRFIRYYTAENESLLDVHIETGRKHQIRKHLSGCGFFVIGDRLYGLQTDKDISQVDLQLTAISLKFICPITRKEKSYAIDNCQLD